MAENQDAVPQGEIQERINNVDEIRSGHELYNDGISMTVTFDHLSEPDAIALLSMFESWDSHAKIGSSRWVSFFVDGDGPFHPEIDISVSDDVVQSDELKDAAEVDTNKFDSDAVTGRFIDYALDVKNPE